MTDHLVEDFAATAPAVVFGVGAPTKAAQPETKPARPTPTAAATLPPGAVWTCSTCGGQVRRDPRGNACIHGAWVVGRTGPRQLPARCDGTGNPVIAGEATR